MPLTQLSLQAVKDLNYLTFRDFLGILPTLAEKDRDGFPLADLQYAALASSPDKPKQTAAKVLRKVYYSGGYYAPDVAPMLIEPGKQTMKDLAAFVHKNHISIFQG